MSTSNVFPRLVTGLVAALIGGAGQGAFAHTLVKEPVTEGKFSFNALNITHVCHTGQFDPQGNEINNPVIAQSVVVPTIKPLVLRPDPADPAKARKIPLDRVIQNGSLEGVFGVIQDSGLFKQQRAKRDSLNNMIGFTNTGGKLQGAPIDGQMIGLVPFTVGGIFFVPQSCAKRLLVKIAVADICRITKTPAPGDVNLWIPNVTPKFPDPDIDGSSATPLGGEPATMIVNRDLVANKLPAGCGAGYDVTVWPSNEDVDTNLPIEGLWPKN